MYLICLTNFLVGLELVTVVWRRPLPHFRARRQEDILKMQWNRSNAIGLAKESCSVCHGDGLRLVHKGREVPCHCVFRAVFRACYNRFRDCVAHGAHTSSISLEFCRGKEGRRTYSRKREDYVADFCLVSRRVLNDFEYKVFRFHFLLGADWRLCSRQLGMDRGTFFHSVYRIEHRLGRVFAELEPYALFPLDEYLGGMTHEPAPPVPARLDRRPPKFSALRLPLTA